MRRLTEERGDGGFAALCFAPASVAGAHVVLSVIGSRSATSGSSLDTIPICIVPRRPSQRHISKSKCVHLPGGTTLTSRNPLCRTAGQ
jgi:hypothetical protein